MTVRDLDRWKSNVELSAGCWHWIGTIRPDGYGILVIEGRQYRVHRLSYEHFIGPIPDGRDLDHECHNRDKNCPGGHTCLHRRCVNPAHLVPATIAENVHRGRRGPRTHCPQNHLYDVENTGFRRGTRYCKKCASQQAYASTKRRRVRDPDYKLVEKERSRTQYLRRQDEIKAQTQTRRGAEEGRAKRRAYYLAHREEILKRQKEIDQRRRTGPSLN